MGSQVTLCTTFSLRCGDQVCLAKAQVAEDLSQVLFQERSYSAVAPSLPSYYRANEVQQFSYSRPFRKGEKDPDNEFAVSPPFCPPAR